MSDPQLLNRRDVLSFSDTHDPAPTFPFLSQHGADVHHPDNDGRTALMLASLNGHSDVTALLLQVPSPAHPFPSLENGAGEWQRGPAWLQCGAAPG